MDLHPPETFLHFLERHAIPGIREKRDFLSAHGEQDDLLVEDFVMLEIVEQRERRARAIARHVNGGARHATNALVFHAREEIIERQANVAETLA